MAVLNPGKYICDSSQIVDASTGCRFKIEQQGEFLPAFIIRYRGKAHAYINQCSHQAFELDWNPGEFFDLNKEYLMCSTHGALFHPESGRCIYGRCNGVGLKKLDVDERDGKVYLLQELKDQTPI